MTYKRMYYLVSLDKRKAYYNILPTKQGEIQTKVCRTKIKTKRK